MLSSDEDIQGFVGYSPLEKMIVLSFRGTANKANGITDVDSAFMRYENSKTI
jgi:hypothetical protein